MVIKGINFKKNSALEAYYNDYFMKLGLSKELSTLDVGCGWGFSSAYFNGRFLGTEFDRNKISWAKDVYPEKDFRFSDITKDQLDKKYDQCLSLTVLDEIEDKDVALRNIISSLNQGAKIYIEVRNYNFLVRELTRYFKLDVYHARKLELKGLKDVDLTFNEYLELFRKSGLRLEKVYKAQRPLISSSYTEFIKKLIYNFIDKTVSHEKAFMLGFVLIKE
ncbi:class I SAM-dependent methyltransferase [Litoribrevibacter euphylliae]|uniref:Class I SAM-dependent methyltransferase n=1 Tax=Litoribrevibacter euphylliae TaxID=1834034 RepID=A0ABV7HC74_9GAMM